MIVHQHSDPMAEEILSADSIGDHETKDLLFKLVDFFDLDVLRTNVGYGQGGLVIRRKGVSGEV